MNPSIETGLAFILFLPVFSIIGVLYCAFPRRPRGVWRLPVDLLVLVVAATLSVFAMREGYHAAAGIAGALWKQIVATLLAYGTFLAIVCIALALRSWLWRRTRPRSCGAARDIIETSALHS